MKSEKRASEQEISLQFKCLDSSATYLSRAARAAAVVASLWASFDGGKR